MKRIFITHSLGSEQGIHRWAMTWWLDITGVDFVHQSVWPCKTMPSIARDFWLWLKGQMDQKQGTGLPQNSNRNLDSSSKCEIKRDGWVAGASVLGMILVSHACHLFMPRNVHYNGPNVSSGSLLLLKTPRTKDRSKGGWEARQENHSQSQLTVIQHSRVLLQAKWPGLTAFVSN